MASLEICLERLDEALAERVIDHEIGILAVNSLTKKKDILKFHDAYCRFMQDFISYELDEKKNTAATRLVKRGYSIENVAAFFVQDDLLFTLGHTYSQDVLKRWYGTLPTCEFPKSMYN